MPSRTARFSMAAALAALLAACGNGGSGGNNGGSGGAGGGGTSTTGSQATTSTTSGTGGAPGCIELCTRLNMCPGTTPSDCATACPDVDSLNTDGMCTAQYQKMVECVLGDSDPCSAFNKACAPDSTVYVMCSSDFCSSNPMHAGCM